MTSIYFEGLAEANLLAQRGHGRDHRPDCKQVCLALVVTREGMPLGYEVCAGGESITLDDVGFTGAVQERRGTREARIRQSFRGGEGAPPTSRRALARLPRRPDPKGYGRPASYLVLMG